MKMPEDCHHENVRTFRSIPPHSKCLECGALVQKRWVRIRVAPPEPKES